MSVVTPTVLAPSRKALEESLARLDSLFDTVQIAVLDGRFAGPASWPYAEPAELARVVKGDIPYLGHFKLEVDLSIENPERAVGAWINAGVERILVHIESVRNLKALIDELANSYGHEKGFAPDLLSFGVALNLETEISVLEPYLDSIDYVQFMSAPGIGPGGGTFDKRVFRKIAAFRKLHPDTGIQVSGKITPETVPELLSAGVSRLCIGAALLSAPDIIEQLHKFETLADEYGRYT